jgi:serine/threonine protein phosphatase 1
MLTYAIGDVHGMARMLETALATISDDADGRPHRIVFLGDYVDRGPENRRVLGILKAGPGRPDICEWVLLRGNHCTMMIECVIGSRESWMVQTWNGNGGKAVVAEYPAGVLDPDIVEDARFLDRRTRLHFRDDQGRIFVHAGLEPGIPLEKQKEDTLLWIREGFLDNGHDHGALVVHGHTITPDRRPQIRRRRVGMDTGAFMASGFLSIGVFEDDFAWPVRWYSVGRDAVRVERHEVDLQKEFYRDPYYFWESPVLPQNG